MVCPRWQNETPEAKVDVAKCHACHVKRSWMSPSATPATQSGAVTGDQSQPKRATRASPVPEVPRLPRKTKVDVTKCHACHVKRRWMSPSATPVPRLPRKTKVDVAKCHACHAKCRDQSQPKRATRASPVP